MIGPILVPVAISTAGAFSAGWAGAIVGFGVGLLIDLAVILGAALWSRQIGALLEPEDALANAPRPPGFGKLVDWVYARVLR